MNKKHTSELLAEFQYKLLDRKSDLYKDIDNRHELDEQNEIYNLINKEEMDRIDKILKSLKKY